MWNVESQVLEEDRNDWMRRRKNRLSLTQPAVTLGDVESLEEGLSGDPVAGVGLTWA